MLDKNFQTAGLTGVQPGEQHLDKTSRGAQLAAVPSVCPECGAGIRALKSSPIRVAFDGEQRREQEVEERLLGWHCSNCPWLFQGTAEELAARETRKRRKPLAGLGQVQREERKRGKRGGSSGVKGRRPKKPGDREAVAHARDARYAECVAAGMGGRVLGQPEKMDLFGLFLAERCYWEDGSRELFSTLYEAFVAWAETNEVAVWSERVFSQKLSERGYKRVLAHRGKTAFLGIRVKRRGIGSRPEGHRRDIGGMPRLRC